MECKSMLLIKNHIPYLWDLPNSFSNSFIDLCSCEVVSWSDIRKNKALSFARFVSIMAVVFKLWNLPCVSSCKMFTFCDVLHETKQKNINKLVRVRNTDWKSSLNQGKKFFLLLLSIGRVTFRVWLSKVKFTRPKTILLSKWITKYH